MLNGKSFLFTLRYQIKYYISKEHRKLTLIDNGTHVSLIGIAGAQFFMWAALKAYVDQRSDAIPISMRKTHWLSPSPCHQ